MIGGIRLRGKQDRKFGRPYLLQQSYPHTKYATVIMGAVSVVVVALILFFQNSMTEGIAVFIWFVAIPVSCYVGMVLQYWDQRQAEEDMDHRLLVEYPQSFSSDTVLDRMVEIEKTIIPEIKAVPQFCDYTAAEIKMMIRLLERVRLAQEAGNHVDTEHLKITSTPFVEAVRKAWFKPAA